MKKFIIIVSVLVAISVLTPAQVLPIVSTSPITMTANEVSQNTYQINVYDNSSFSYLLEEIVNSNITSSATSIGSMSETVRIVEDTTFAVVENSTIVSNITLIFHPYVPTLSIVNESGYDYILKVWAPTTGYSLTLIEKGVSGSALTFLLPSGYDNITFKTFNYTKINIVGSNGSIIVSKNINPPSVYLTYQYAWWANFSYILYFDANNLNNTTLNVRIGNSSQNITVNDSIFRHIEVLNYSQFGVGKYNVTVQLRDLNYTYNSTIPMQLNPEWLNRTIYQNNTTVINKEIPNNLTPLVNGILIFEMVFSSFMIFMIFRRRKYDK